jgi:glycine hydroxymethyltransferase
MHSGKVVGVVTSCAVDREGYLLGQAYLQRKYTAEGTPIGVYQGATADPVKPVKRLRPGDRTPVPTPAKVLSRFPR